MKHGREAAIEIAMEIMDEEEWVPLEAITRAVNEKHYKEFTMRGLGMLLNGAVKRMELEKKRFSDAGVRYMAYRLKRGL